MIIGESFKKRHEKLLERKEEAYRLMVPHEIFAWLPHRLTTGEYIWLSKVWRFASNFDPTKVEPTEFGYTLTEARAFEETRISNARYPRFSDQAAAARSILGIQY